MMASKIEKESQLKNSCLNNNLVRDFIKHKISKYLINSNELNNSFN
jgi:hypothetical protein